MSPLGRGQIPMLDAARHAPIAANSGGRRVYHVRRQGVDVLTFDVGPWEIVIGHCEPGGEYREGNPPPAGVAPYPHEGSCAECRAAFVCNYCGDSTGGRMGGGRCTNGRCYRCHSNVCTPGGATSPGHGFGDVGGKHFAADRKAAAIADPSSVAIDELPIEAAESWCTECEECHLDANDENAHRETTGHRATRDIGKRFGA